MIRPLFNRFFVSMLELKCSECEEVIGFANARPGDIAFADDVIFITGEKPENGALMNEALCPYCGAEYRGDAAELSIFSGADC